MKNFYTKIIKNLLQNWLFLFFIMFNNFSLFGDIVRVEKISEIHQLLLEIKEDNLIVFDVDDVIFSTEDHFAHPYGYLTFVKLTNQALNSASTDKEKEEIMRKVSLSQLLARRLLVEEDMPQFIRNLQDAGIKIIALTNFPRGQYGAISRTEAWRIEQLKSFGIDFSRAFPDEMHGEFHEMAQPGLAPPLFEKGILFSNGHPKGEVLTTFFKKNLLSPSKVIFIEDLLHHHNSVESSLRSLKISFIGIHYTGANKYFGVCNEGLLRYQFDHLLSTETWISDKQIMALWNQSRDLDP
jgi:hypothetical protein